MVEMTPLERFAVSDNDIGDLSGSIAAWTLSLVQGFIGYQVHPMAAIQVCANVMGMVMAGAPTENESRYIIGSLIVLAVQLKTHPTVENFRTLGEKMEALLKEHNPEVYDEAQSFLRVVDARGDQAPEAN